MLLNTASIWKLQKPTTTTTRTMRRLSRLPRSRSARRKRRRRKRRRRKRRRRRKLPLLLPSLLATFPNQIVRHLCRSPTRTATTTTTTTTTTTARVALLLLPCQRAAELPRSPTEQSPLWRASQPSSPTSSHKQKDELKQQLCVFTSIR
jgi:hypothetical protein